MATNRNQVLAAKSAATPARYSRALARRLWRQSFGSTIAWRRARQHGRQYSFRSFVAGTFGVASAVETTA